MAEEEKIKFVTIELSAKQVLKDQGLIHNDKTNKDYVRCLTPDGGTFIYPADSLKYKKDNENIVYFQRPEDAEFMIRYSKVKEGVDPKDMSIPNEEKYESYDKIVTAAELYSMYNKNERFVGCDISEKLVRFFTSKNGNEMANVSVPVYASPDAEKADFYDIVLPKNRIFASDQEGKMYLSMFRNDKDGNAYAFKGEMSIKNLETGAYDVVEKEFTSEEIVQAFKDNAERYRTAMQSQDRTVADSIARK